ncbi:MAG: hypothetical protein JXB07_12430 [Anaerolineae bacterium]|nr:hypothetical protein [Anaerolineae bacterium]
MIEKMLHAAAAGVQVDAQLVVLIDAVAADGVANAALPNIDACPGVGGDQIAGAGPIV